MGLRAAARMTGRNQSTIHRAMKNGRLSYTLNEAGERQIDVAELERVFGIRSPSADVPMINGASGQAVAPAVQSKAGHAGETAVLERLLWIERQPLPTCARATAICGTGSIRCSRS